ncbi:MAG TPA: alpha/beta hydrolase [Polyangiaceae bacterium]|nr:alpha/beta hydrolase [Polyangiaceae bacterium]
MLGQIRTIVVTSLVALAFTSGCNQQKEQRTEATPNAPPTPANPGNPSDMNATDAGATNPNGPPGERGERGAANGNGTATPKDWRSRADKDMKAVLDELAALGAKPIESLTPAEARKQPTLADAVNAELKKEGKSTTPEAVAKVENRTIKAGSTSLPVRIYTPKDAKAPYPVLVYFHGGGFVIATNDTYDASARGLANGAKAVVVAVDYRKAPENKFPAAEDDANAAYAWVLKNAGSFAGDPKNVAVAGESAGGNLALNVAITARDKKEELPTHVLLVYPLATTDPNTDSRREFANAKPLDDAMLTWFTNEYLRTPADAKDPRVDLVNANLAGLPDTTIINAEIDPLASDGELLEKKLEAAKVNVKRKVYDGVTHEFFGLGAVVGKAKDAMDFATSRLKDAFAKREHQEANTTSGS